MAYTDIDKPSDYFNTVTYTGTGTSGGNTLGVTGVGFQPDLVWVKNRTAAVNHYLYDVVRGTGSAKALHTNTTDSEASASTYSVNGGVASLDSDGFTAYRGTDNTYQGTNMNGQAYASWNWKAGGTAVSNTDGDITSSVSANTTSGFSIVSWTGNGSSTDTVGHGLGVAPKIVLYKTLNLEANWYYWSTQFDGSNQILIFNSPSTVVSSLGSTYGSITSSTISNFGWDVGDNIIAYCFAEKKGFSKFGKYTANGSTDGPFVYTGFKPAFVIFKSYNLNSNINWTIFDNKRNTYNELDEELRVNRTLGSRTLIAGDFTSNGFKLRSTNRPLNEAGRLYIYMAFAENPLVTSTGIPTTAR